MAALIEGIDYYMEGGFMVFTEAYHRNRGYCCDSGCRHCPWKESPAGDSVKDNPAQLVSDSTTDVSK